MTPEEAEYVRIHTRQLERDLRSIHILLLGLAQACQYMENWIDKLPPEK